MVEPDSKQAVDAWVGIGVTIFLSLLFIRYMLRLGEDQFAHLEEAAVEEAGEFKKGETVEERRRKTNALLDVENDPAHDKQVRVRESMSAWKTRMQVLHAFRTKKGSSGSRNHDEPNWWLGHDDDGMPKMCSVSRFDRLGKRYEEMRGVAESGQKESREQQTQDFSNGLVATSTRRLSVAMNDGAAWDNAGQRRLSAAMNDGAAWDTATQRRISAVIANEEAALESAAQAQREEVAGGGGEIRVVGDESVAEVGRLSAAMQDQAAWSTAGDHDAGALLLQQRAPPMKQVGSEGEAVSPDAEGEGLVEVGGGEDEEENWDWTTTGANGNETFFEAGSVDQHGAAWSTDYNAKEKAKERREMSAKSAYYTAATLQVAGAAHHRAPTRKGRSEGEAAPSLEGAIQQLDVGIEVGGGEDDQQQHQLPEDHLTVANGKALEQEVAKIRTTATAVVANPNPNVDNAKKAVDERANKRTTKTLKEEQQMQRLQNFAKKEAHRRQRAALLAELRDVHPRGWISVTFVVTFTFAVLLCVIWSHMLGFGAKVYKWGLDQHEWADFLWYSSACILFGLYCLDFYTCPVATCAHEGLERFVEKKMGAKMLESLRDKQLTHFGQRHYLVLGLASGKASPWGSHLCRFLFALSITMALSWGVSTAGQHPHYPVICMLVLFGLAQVVVRLLLRPPEHREILFEDFLASEKGADFGNKNRPEIGEIDKKFLARLNETIARLEAEEAEEDEAATSAMMQRQANILREMRKQLKDAHVEDKVTKEAEQAAASAQTPYEHSMLCSLLAVIPDPQARRRKMLQVLKQHLLDAHDHLLYYKAVTISLWLGGVCCLICWLLWAFVVPTASGVRNQWGAGVRAEMARDGIKPSTSRSSGDVTLTGAESGMSRSSVEDHVHERGPGNGLLSRKQAFGIQWNVWAAPPIFAGGLLLGSLLMALRSFLHLRYAKTDELLDEVAHSVANEDAKQGSRLLHASHVDKLTETVKTCFCILLAAVLLLWVGVEVATGASESLAESSIDVAGIAKTILALGFVSAVVGLGATMKRLERGLMKEAYANPFLKMAVEVLQSDWIKALFLLLLWWVIPAYYFLSCLNKGVRAFRGARDRFVDDYKDHSHHLKQGRGDKGTAPNARPPAPRTAAEEKDEDGFSRMDFLPEPYHRYCTEHVSHQLSTIYWRWDKISVLTKAYILGMAIFLISIGFTKGLNLILIWLNDVVAGMSPFAVTGIWYGAALIGFLLPPIPGPPLYLFGGLVVVRAWEQEWDAHASQESSGGAFWTALVFVYGITVFLKLNASAMQQKCIGQPLGNYPTIRSLVGVHKPTIRAIEVVLRQKGLSFGKCAILCGGPDWPTSVLCGVLRVNLFEIMIGTLPVLLEVVPCVSAGAFKRKTSPLFASLTSVAMLFSALFLSGLGIAALYAIQQVLDNHTPLLTIPLEENRELHWLDWKEERRGKIFKKYSKWSRLSLPLRGYIVLGFLLQSLQCYMFLQKGGDCFGDLEQILVQDAETGNLELYWDLKEPPNPRRATASEAAATAEGATRGPPEQVQVLKPAGQYAAIALLGGTIIYFIYTHLLRTLAKRELDAFERSVGKHRAKFDRELDQQRDASEKEMAELYPEDYEVYLEHTKRPRLVQLSSNKSFNTGEQLPARWVHLK